MDDREERELGRAWARGRALAKLVSGLQQTPDVEGLFRLAGEAFREGLPYETLYLYLPWGENPGSSFSVRTITEPEEGAPARVRMRESTDDEISALVVQALAAREPSTRSKGGERELLLPVGDVGVVRLSARSEPTPEDVELLGQLASLLLLRHRAEGRAAKKSDDNPKLRSLGELAAGVAHDFNNVLSAILGRAQLLKAELDDASHRGSLEVIEKAAMDAATTVRRIQEFAKQDAHRRFTAVEVNRLVEDTVERVRAKIEARQNLRVLAELGQHARILGSAAELRQVLTNMLYNAADAMPEGGRLWVRTGRLDGRAFFEVEDSGLGMDEQTQAKIFTPFFSTKGQAGTGLGLSVSYGIVQRHHGDFEVWSKLGTGSRIRVLVPVIQTEAPPPILSESQQMRAAPGPSEGRRTRILVIDDDTAVRDVLADILRTGDYHVVAAASGAEGLERFESQAFDLVFTDLGMPGMNGWEVAAGIKLLSPSTPVGLITGWEANLDEGRVKRHGIDVIVPKPFRFQQVLDLVREAISRGS